MEAVKIENGVTIHFENRSCFQADHRRVLTDALILFYVNNN